MKKVLSILVLLIGFIANSQCSTRPSRFDRIQMQCLNVSTDLADKPLVITSTGLIMPMNRSLTYQDLESILGFGNTTTHNIISSGGFYFQSGSGNYVNAFNDGIYLNTNGTPFSHAILKSDNLSTLRTLQMPDANGTFGISVNGTPFDSNGNVVISTGSGTVTNVTATSPIHITSTSTITPNVTVDNAAADNTTFGVSTYLPADFNSSVGAISLDYTNGQKATGSIPGYLLAADWTTFNNKQAALSGTGFVKSTAGTISYDTSSYQPLDSDLTAIAALATDSFGRDLLIKTTAANVRSYIGAGTGDGTITSVSGTASRITSTGGSTPVIDISSTFEASLKKVKFRSGTATSALTGTTTETQMLQLTIPVGTYSLNDFININHLRLVKTTATSTVTWRIKISTSSTMPTGNTDRVAVFTDAAGARSQEFTRSFWQTGGNLTGIDFTTSASNDLGITTTGLSTKAFDNTTTLYYLYVSAQLTNSADSVYIASYEITN